jgi:hypothetical protein
VGNEGQTDHASVVFFYSLDPPVDEAPLTPGLDRRVTAPTRVVFVPGWNVPIHTTSLQNATWTKRTATVGGKEVRHLSMRTTGDDIFGPHHLSFICAMPSAGLYQVGIRALLGPDQGIVQLSRHDMPVGETVDLYAPSRGLSEVLPLGVQELDAGDNRVFLKLVDRDERSSGLGLELVEIVFERVD